MGSLTARGLELVGQCTKMLDDVGAQGFQEREELAPNSGPEVARVAVRRIAGERNGVACAVIEDGLARGANERTDSGETRRRGGRRAWGQRRETEWARAAQESYEHRLGAIVGVVTGGDDARRNHPSGGLERVVATSSRTCLEVSTFGDVDRGAIERDVEGPREFRSRVQLERSFGSKAVIDAVGKQNVPDVVPQNREHVEKRHGVGPAAHGHEHAIAP